MSDLLDLDALKRLLDVIGGEAEDFDELRDEFIETSPDLIETLQQAAAHTDLDAMRVASHSLKGNARDFGATALAELSAALETACKSGDVDGAIQLLSQVTEAEKAARHALLSIEASNLG
ncbi:MAG: Hpt domain-containing protein [Pseudomonadota bacterium]